MNINKEDYIKAIYELGGESKRVSNKEIASRLGLAPASVSQMIKKLLADDYISYREYRGVRLRPKGVELGLSLRRRHLLWEVFLVDKLGYSWDQVHQLAEELEHITGPELEARLENFLGRPQTCPHGSFLDPPGQVQASLLDQGPGQFIIRRIQDEEDILDFAQAKGLRLGDRLLVLEELATGYLVEFKGLRLEVDKNLAGKIFLEEEV